jgi:hypothetical protein
MRYLNEKNIFLGAITLDRFYVDKSGNLKIVTILIHYNIQGDLFLNKIFADSFSKHEIHEI